MDAVTLLEQARQYEQDQAWPDALATYEQALALDPADAEVRVRLGVLHSRLDEFDRAEHYYRCALGLDGDRLDARFNLGLLYKRQDRAQEAQIEFEEFLSLAKTQRDITKGKELLNEVAGIAYEKCAKCGSISILGVFYRSTLQGKLCPRCYPQSRVIQSALSWAFLGLAGLAVAALSYFVQPWAFYLLVNLALAMLLTYTLIIPHELCHAAAGWLLGGKVFEVRIGIGPNLWQKRFGDVTLSLGRYPIGGQTAVAFPTRDRLKTRLLIMVSAGLLFNAAVLVLLAPFGSAARLGATFAPLEAFALANFSVFVVNLVPRKVSLGALRTGTDGHILLQLLLGKLTAEESRLGYFVYEGAYALRRRAFAQAVEAADDGLAQYPDSTYLKNLRAVALLELERHTEALAVFQELLARFQAEQPAEELGIRAENRDVMRAILLNNIAYTSLLDHSSPEQLRQARDHAREAFRLTPWVVHVQGTWGSVLVETGRSKEGIDHLLEACKHHDEDRGKAANLAYAAIAYHRLGDEAKAAATLHKATALDATEYMVKRAQAELGVRPEEASEVS